MTRPFTFLLLLLATSLQLEEVSSFAPSAQRTSTSTTRRTNNNIPRHHHHHQSSSPPLHLNLHNLHTSPLHTQSYPSCPTRLYSAAAGNPNGSHHPNNNSLRQLKQVNGAVLQKGTIPLSTNQGIGFGCLLAWTSGLINGATLMGLWSRSQGTAALTGTYTKSALFLAKGDYANAGYLFLCILTWVSGSTLVGFLVPESSAVEVQHPRGLATSLVIGAAAVATAGIMGFRSQVSSNKSFILLCLLANGIQDAISSGGGWRTTHLTGITCDLGLFVGQLLRRRSTKQLNMTKMKAFSLLTLTFWMGAFLSVPLSTIFGSLYLLGVAGAYLAMAASIGIYFLRQRLDW